MEFNETVVMIGRLRCLTFGPSKVYAKIFSLYIGRRRGLTKRITPPSSLKSAAYQKYGSYYPRLAI